MESQKQSDKPEIGTKTNKDLENEKAKERKGGGLAPFWTSVGGKAAAGTAGSAGAGAGGMAWGAMFATKTGILTLALVGSTLAGGLGWIGYRNVGHEGKGEAPFSSLFAAKPQNASNQSSQTGSSSQGGGSSLQFLVDANKNDPALSEPPAEAAAAPAAPTADALAASNSNANTAVDQTPMSGPSSSKPSGLSSGKKFGSLSSGLASGSSGAGIRFGTLGGAGEVSNMPQLASAKGKTIGPRDARASLSGQRALGYNRLGSAGRQLAQVRRDHRGATSSSGAGRTYDGGGAAGSIGPEAAAPEGAAGSGDPGVADRKINPSDASRSEVNEPPPTETGKNVTPWQDALQQGMMLLAASTVLLMIAKKLAQMARNAPNPTSAWQYTAAKIVAGLAGAAGLAAVYLGSQITFGEYNQPIQGAALMLGGAAAAAAAGIVAFNPDTFSEKEYGNVEGLLDICGYVGMAAIAATMLVPKKEYDSSKFKGGKAPDAKIFGYQRSAPSDHALERFTV